MLLPSSERGANSGPLGVIWVLEGLSGKVGPLGFLFMEKEAPAAHPTVEAGHCQS